MRILRTAHFGMCFGVRDAIAVAKWVDFRNEDVSLNGVSLWYPQGPTDPLLRVTTPSDRHPPGRRVDLDQIWLSGGRTWWAHFELTRMNIELTILKKEIEDLLDVREDCAERTEPRAFV